MEDIIDPNLGKLACADGSRVEIEVERAAGGDERYRVQRVQTWPRDQWSRPMPEDEFLTDYPGEVPALRFDLPDGGWGAFKFDASSRRGLSAATTCLIQRLHELCASMGPPAREHALPKFEVRVREQQGVATATVEPGGADVERCAQSALAGGLQLAGGVGWDTIPDYEYRISYSAECGAGSSARLRYTYVAVDRR